MKVKHIVTACKPRPSNVTLELTSMEAGWLRSILYKNNTNGFSDELFKALDNLTLEDYEHKYPDWRECKG